MFYIMSVYDRKAKLYAPPFACKSLAEATRGFSQFLSDPKSIPAQYPTDFELIHICSIDEVDASNISVKNGDTLLPVSLGLAVDFLTGGSNA